MNYASFPFYNSMHDKKLMKLNNERLIGHPEAMWKSKGIAVIIIVSNMHAVCNNTT